MIGGPGLRNLSLNEAITRQEVKPGTIRRILPYVKQYQRTLILLIIVTAADAVITVANPLLLRLIINDGILPRHVTALAELSLSVAILGLVDAAAVYAQTLFSARAGQGIIYDLRTKVFSHIQQQPLAFFTRTQTGALISRLNTDVVGAQQALTTLLSQTVSTLLTLTLVLAAMFYLSWQISVVSLALIPLFILPGKSIGKRLQRLTREEMQLDASLASIMSERFNVAGAMLTKLYGRPDEEAENFASQAKRVRDITALTSVYARTYFIIITFLAALATALVYGLGGDLVVNGAFQIGTLVAMITLLTRLYGPINQLSSMQVNVLTALVSFDRVFELLDLQPLVTDKAGAIALPQRAADDDKAPSIDFNQVFFRYPAANEVSLSSLESIALPNPETPDDSWTLQHITFHVPPGHMTALIGPSGAGKSTITQLLSRLYDPNSGSVRINGHDIREVMLGSLRETIGVVTQDAHLFHDTIRANLAYARPAGTEQELIQACKAAQIWDLVSSLPDGLDTVVGDRGYRLSGGEKQRISLARLLIKAPPIVVLDEATAHLDSESEAAIQLALKTVLAGRTSLVIAHRLSTIRNADQILVLDAGQIREQGTHDELLTAGSLYTTLYHTQFAGQINGDS